MCEGVVALTSFSTPTSSSSSPVTPTPEILYPLWGFTRYGKVSDLHFNNESLDLSFSMYS